MKKHKLLSISAVIMMLSAYGCSLDEFNPSGISTEQEWSTPAGYEKKVNDCYFDLVRIVYGQAEDTYLMVAEGGTDIWLLLFSHFLVFSVFSLKVNFLIS